MRLLILLGLLGAAQAKLRGSIQLEDLAPARALAQSCDNNGGCQNGSTCRLNDVGLIWCMNCPAGYSGFRCENAPTSGRQSCTPPETGGACQNGSKCNLNSAGLIYCSDCPAGYSGFRCEISPAGTATTKQTCTPPVTDGPCQNGSTCTVNSAGYIYCTGCPSGYSGFRCEIPPAGVTTKQTCTPPETGGPCQNGSQCTLNSAGYIYCTGCPAGYKGDRCEIAPTGTVTATTTKQTCTPPETDGPCQNGSTCTLNSAGYIYCTGCPAGYSGFRCEIAPAGKQNCANPADGPCQNGSTCTVNSAGYIYCVNCPAGYSGFRCEKPPAAKPTQAATTAATTAATAAQTAATTTK